jgi:hypothetical protein
VASELADASVRSLRLRQAFLRRAVDLTDHANRSQAGFGGGKCGGNIS